MHVLITGASGYFGSVLRDRLLHSPQVSKVSVFSRDGAGSPAGLPANIDVVSFSELGTAAFARRRFDALFHLAAGRSATDSAQLAGSLALTAQLMRAASEVGITRIFYASSQAVYGVQDGPWSEDTAVAPATSYGMMKYACELLAGNASAQAVSLRFCKLVGPSPNFRVSASEIPHVLCQHAFEDHAISVKHPDQKFDLLDVRDAADACARLLEMDATSLPAVLNIGSGRQTRLADCAELVHQVGSREFAKPLHYLIDATDGGGAYRNFGMTIDQVTSCCGWLPAIPLKTTIGDIFRGLHARR